MQGKLQETVGPTVFYEENRSVGTLRNERLEEWLKIAGGDSLVIVRATIPPTYQENKAHYPAEY